MNAPFAPPEQGIIPSRFKAINYADAKTIVLWDMGDMLQRKRIPQPWCTAEYRDPITHDIAKRRMLFLCGMLNGIRAPSEVIEIV